jgi:hypothetical protein
MCPFTTAGEPKTEHSIQQSVYSSVVICVSVVTETRSNPAVTNVLSEALSRECVFPETVAQQWSIPRCVNSAATARCHGYSLSEALPSNGLFRFSGVMSQYYCARVFPATKSGNSNYLLVYVCFLSNYCFRQ